MKQKPKASKEYKDYMFTFIDKICKNIGPRLATREEEHKAINLIKEELNKSCDKTITQDFKTAYTAYPRGLVRFGGGLCLIGFFFLFTTIPYICAILSLIGLLAAVGELLFLKSTIDIFYKKGNSKNVFGKIKPKNETKKFLIFGGHSDSAFELPFAKNGVPAMQRRLYGAIALGVFAIIWSIVKSILLLLNITLPFTYTFLPIFGFNLFIVNLLDYILLIPFIPWLFLFLQVLINFFGDEIVEGANDNLSGIAVAIAIAKYLNKEENRPNNVEVWCGSFGAEEAGQRGSRAFVKQTPREILENSYAVILESVGGGEGIGILTAETMYLTINSKFPFIHPITHDSEVYNCLYESYEIAKKKKAGFPPSELLAAKFAGTDAVRFSEKGYKACAIVGGGMETMFIKNWHSLEDTPENLNKNLMKAALDICVEFIDSVDKELE
ncbi:MAG: M28 family peptidase [Candidatus Lokiarchaeota archaeon]|nr:M28 family peptidase [Candidatus Lokiarchaeota archaeon]